MVTLFRPGLGNLFLMLPEMSKSNLTDTIMIQYKYIIGYIGITIRINNWGIGVAWLGTSDTDMLLLFCNGNDLKNKSPIFWHSSPLGETAAGRWGTIMLE
jgi:hypothetical protein